MNKEKSNSGKFTIVVTDSGLGGLSITAELERELNIRKNIGAIDIIFFNSLASSDFGYNSMPTWKKKAEVFDSALNSIVNIYNPDMILIACNTLSVVYEDTNFAKDTAVDVIGIIDIGVESILEKIESDSNQTILLLGTPTTISSLSYQNKLIGNGIDKKAIINQACPLLESEIQRTPKSKEVSEMIESFLTDAKEKELIESDKILAALCCTHYGYSEVLFQKLLEFIFKKDATIINPNNKMVEIAVARFENLNLRTTEINIKVVSQVKLKETEIISIASVLESVSENTASALRNYDYNPSLFTFNR